MDAAKSETLVWGAGQWGVATWGGADPDSDLDGVGDSSDAFPQDPTEQVDSEGDGIGNNQDLDDDNDGWFDSLELELGLDPLKSSNCPTAICGSPVSGWRVKLLLDEETDDDE